MSCVRNSCICFRSHASRALHEGLPQTLMMEALIGEAYLFVDRIFADNDFCRHGICRILEIIDLQELPLKFFVRHNNLVGSVSFLRESFFLFTLTCGFESMLYSLGNALEIIALLLGLKSLDAPIRHQEFVLADLHRITAPQASH